MRRLPSSHCRGRASRYRNRALQSINREGAANFVKNADALAAKYGARFGVPQLVRDKAAKNALFA